MSKLLISEPPLQVLPSLAVKIGLNEAIILQQMHYWLERSKHLYNNEYWIYNTYADWQKQLPFWSEATIKRAIKKLEGQGLLIVGNYNKLKIDNTKWYRIDYLALEEVEKRMSRPSGHFDQTERSKCIDGEVNLTRPLPETTTETTTETTLNPKGLSVEKPSTDEQSNPPPIKEKSSSQNTVFPAHPKTQIKDTFIDLTGMSMPKVKNQQGYWWSQFGEILHIAKDDPNKACESLCQVVSYMQKEGLCISGPQSVVGLCRAVMSGQKLNGGTNEKTGRNSQVNGRPDGHSLGTIAFNPKTGETVHV